MMPAGHVAGHHPDSDSTLLSLLKSAITWFGGIFARLTPLAVGLIGSSKLVVIKGGNSSCQQDDISRRC